MILINYIKTWGKYLTAWILQIINKFIKHLWGIEDRLKEEENGHW